MAEKFKTSWELLKEVYGKKIQVPVEEAGQSKEYGKKYDEDKEGYELGTGGGKRTPEGRKKIDTHSIEPAIPAFCPECGKIIKGRMSEITYIAKRHCLYCEIQQRAEDEGNDEVKNKK